MTTYTITKSGDYKSSASTFTGTKKDALNYLRSEACRMRRESRLLHKLPDNVHSIPPDRHPSKLVTMASYHLTMMGMEQLLSLINNHGVLVYKIDVETNNCDNTNIN